MSDVNKLDPKEAIVNVLQSGPKKPGELRSEVLKLGVSKSTYHYALKQLIKRGEVEDTKYSYKGSRVSDNVLQEILSPITASTEPQQIELSKNLEFLARQRGIALKALFLSKIEDCLTSKLVEVRRSALSALSQTLRNLSETSDDKRAREIIVERLYSKITDLVKSDDDSDIRGRAIKILAAFGDPEAIETLIDIVEKATSNDYDQLKTYLKEAIVWPYAPSRLPKNYLTRYHHAKILNRLSKLASEGNNRASELADLIRHGALD